MYVLLLLRYSFVKRYDYINIIVMYIIRKKRIIKIRIRVVPSHEAFTINRVKQT